MILIGIFISIGFIVGFCFGIAFGFFLKDEFEKIFPQEATEKTDREKFNNSIKRIEWGDWTTHES